MKLITKTIIVITIFYLIIAGGNLEASETTSLKALIVTGRMGPWHNWQVSSPILKQYLEETGLFKVDVAKPLPGDEGVKNFKPSFADYNVVVVDYDDVDDPDWPEETKKAFADYVSSGGGVVIYHSSNNSFPKWKEYNEIIGLAGWGERDANAGPLVYLERRQDCFR
ncbi:MAG: ThuA domain-containing protein [Phycisphaerae bacterium]|nr:ThuA domain-containing protein [Phycisphaerae bacterium]